MPAAPGWFRRSAATTATGTTSLSLTLPTGVLDDDILVAGIAHKGADWGVWPGGWILLGREVQDGLRGEAYWKRASSETGPYSITGLDTSATGVLCAYGGGLASGSPVGAVVTGTAASGSLLDTSAVLSTSTVRQGLTVLTAIGANQPAHTNGVRTGTPGSGVIVAVDGDVGQLWRRASATTATGGGSACTLHEGQKIVAGDVGTVRAVPSTSFLGTFTGPGVLIAIAWLPETAAAGTGTRYYWARKRPACELTGGWQGAWDTSDVRDYNTRYGFSLPTWELSETKSDAGRQATSSATSNDPGTTRVLARWVTPPLAAQTIAGTLTAVFPAGQTGYSPTLFPATIPDVYTRIHAYITAGDSLEVRHTLINSATDAESWPYINSVVLRPQITRWMGLDAPMAITSGAALAGDRVCIEFGCTTGTFTAPKPPPDRPPEHFGYYLTQYGTQATDSAFGAFSLPAQTDGVASGNVSVQESPFFEWSQTLTALGTPPPSVSNDTLDTATVITGASVSVEIGPTQGSASPGRAAWYAWVAPSTGVYFVHGFGTQFGADISLFEPVDGFNGYLGYAGGSHIGNGYSAPFATVEVTGGVTYYIRVQQYRATSMDDAFSGGGYARLSIAPYQAPADGDVFTSLSGYVVRYNRAGQLCDANTAVEGVLASGLAIDYTGRPLESLQGGINTGHRLLVMSYAVWGLVEILDLPRLYLDSAAELDYIGAFDVASSSNWEDGGLCFGSSLSVTTNGTLLTGWWGNGFQLIAGPYNSYLNEPATTNSANIAEIDATHGANQPGDPWPDATRLPAAVAVGGVNYLEVGPDNDTIYYTSSGWYRPIGGQTVKRYSRTSGQLADFATIPVGPGSNPALKGLFPLTDGTVLVCNGGQIVRLSPGGTVIQTYTGPDPDRANSFADVEPTSDMRHFWAIDEESGSIYLFDLVTGAVEVDVFPRASFGGNTSLVVYRVSDPTPTYATRTVPQRRLRRAPHLTEEQTWRVYPRLQLDLRTGIGLAEGQGSDPQLMLRWSNDGGHTWSSEHWTSAGRMGARKTRAIWRRLGRARVRTFEVSVSDPVPWYLAGAWLDVEPGTGN